MRPAENLLKRSVCQSMQADGQKEASRRKRLNVSRYVESERERQETDEEHTDMLSNDYVGGGVKRERWRGIKTILKGPQSRNVIIE